MKAEKKLYTLTPEHRQQLKPWAERWIANALSTKPMDDGDREAMRAAIVGMYEAAKLEPPRNIVFCASPFTGAIASGIAAGAWWLRDNPEKQVELFGRALTESDIMGAVVRACAFAVRSAWRFNETLARTESPQRAPGSDAATRDATFAATNAATRAATRYATADATNTATADATNDATRAATDVATRAATDVATDVATRAATRVATDAATRYATADATNTATADATNDATRVATDVATRAATDVATDVATRAATYAATRDATRVATRAATDAAYAATRAATRVATDVATRAATYAATRDATNAESSVDPVASFLVQCTQYHWRLWNGGNMWSGWAACLSFFRHVAKLPIDYGPWSHYESAAIHAGPRWMHARFAIVSDRPEILRTDEIGRPHAEDGPSHRWRDGWELYFWRGTRVPAAWIRQRKELDPTVALTWENVEQRRAAAEIIGWARILDQLKPRVINRNKSPYIGELLEVDLPDAERSRFLKVLCGTGRTFVLPVPREMRTALEANAWTYGLKPHELKLEART